VSIEDSGDMIVKEKIKEMITSSKHQQISYAEYMSVALYDRESGYYMKAGEKVGRQGDFITTSNIGNIYGQLIARWYYKQVSKGNIPANVCEIGAGSGRFAQAFLEEWSLITTEPITYFVLEASPFHQQLIQKEIDDGKIKIIDSLSKLKGFHGMIFSNELFDALPVHVIEKKKGILHEVMITVENEDLKELLVPLANTNVQSYVSEYMRDLQEHERAEVPIAMVEFIKEISKIIDSGILLSVDYGYTDSEWEEPARSQGSLRGYSKHTMKTNLLAHPGEMDITSHVQWDPFIRIGKKYDLNLERFIRQDEFFLEIGILDLLKDHYDPNPFSEQSKRNRAIRSLITPGGMSSHFQVVVQSKNLSKEFSI
jgi:SAM-dependent MidA family methyltransferase